MKKIQINLILLFLLSTLISFTFLACDDQPVNHPPQMNEEELITSVWRKCTRNYRYYPIACEKYL